MKQILKIYKKLVENLFGIMALLFVGVIVAKICDYNTLFEGFKNSIFAALGMQGGILICWLIAEFESIGKEDNNER